jgi:hypothetical protein
MPLLLIALALAQAIDATSAKARLLNIHFSRP